MLAGCSNKNSEVEEPQTKQEEVKKEDTSKKDDQNVEDSKQEDKKEENTNEDKSSDKKLKVGETTSDPDFGDMTLYAMQELDQTQTSGNFEIKLKDAGLAVLKPNDMVKEVLQIKGDQATMLTINMEITHNVDQTESIYPNQGTIVTNNGSQIDANMFVSEDVGGDFLGKVNKKGQVIFLFDDDVETVKNIRYIVKAPVDSEFYAAGEDLEFKFDIK